MPSSMRAQTLTKDRLKTAAISEYVAHYREELLRELPDEVKVNKNKKRAELIRLGRVRFSQLPESVQRQYYKGLNTSGTSSRKDIVESEIVRVPLPRSPKMEPSSLGGPGVRELRGGRSNHVAAPSVACLAGDGVEVEDSRPSPPHLHPQAQSTTSPLAQENQPSESSGSCGVRVFQKFLAPGAPSSPRPSFKRSRAFLEERAPSAVVVKGRAWPCVGRIFGCIEEGAWRCGRTCGLGHELSLGNNRGIIHVCPQRASAGESSCHSELGSENGPDSGEREH